MSYVTRTDPDKLRENRIRRIARKYGYRIHKSRMKTIHFNNLCGYMIVDRSLNAVVAGGSFELELDDLEAFFSEEEAFFSEE